MYSTLLVLHSFTRWLVLLSLLYALGTALVGWLGNRPYRRTDATARVAATSFSHLQLLIGFTLYFVSPLVQQFLKNGTGVSYQMTFFGLYHIATMFTAVVVMTIGSSLAKRAETDKKKFSLTVLYFSISLLLIIAAIPWFRPYLRSF